MKQYEMFELVFAGGVPADGWAQVDLTAEFACGETVRTVKGFYDGDGRYAVRFLPERAGVWRWTVRGAVNAQGTEVCAPAEGAHGPVRAVGTHFEHADGTLFHPFGTTVYALAHQDDALVERTLESLRAAPFNKVRMCVFPKHYDYNHNEPPCYPFEKTADGWDVHRPCIAFWQRFEGILGRIADMGIQVDLILFHPYDRWGFAALPQADNLVYLDYLLRRLAAFPGIWWSLANEYDLCAEHKTLADWEEIEAYTAENDPYRHLLSCHNCMCFWDFTRPAVTHASIQTKALCEIPRWLREHAKPVVIDECCYEGDLPHFWGSISGQEMVRRFWRCFASGAYCTHGETFLAEDEVLWWARGGTLKGESPARIAFLREIAESLPGPLTPAEGGFTEQAQLEGEALEKAAQGIPAEMRGFFLSFAESVRRMDVRDRTAHLGSEHVWEARCGEEAYLTYFDLQCYGEQTVRLPEDGLYRAELIDPWNMTREVIAEGIRGETRLKLPGRDNLALLITRQA
ncbi:MAG: DUF5060 domain-containing protein [Clostridia bacterium]|nr:DUF5060 domain-containing protein [Clostridia bacterium]